MNIFKHNQKGFTLLETLASIAVLSLVIIGPLAVTISSSGYARLTKDTIVATYLAEEAVELLQNQYDSMYIYCKKNVSAIEVGGLCEPSAQETTTGETAWRLFKNRLSGLDGGPTCFLPKGSMGSYPGNALGNASGCAFDSVSLKATSTQSLPRYDASAGDCKYLMPVSTSTTIVVASTTGGNIFGDQLAADQGGSAINYGYRSITSTSTSYVCKGVPENMIPGGVVQPKQYIRSVTIEQLPTFEAGTPQDQQYSDDLRVTSSVQFKALNGMSHTIKITRFMHARP